MSAQYSFKDGSPMGGVMAANRRLCDIAAEIRADWQPVNYAAVPYLNAMAQLTLISDKYYEETGSSVVAYFLANAGTWRGGVARRVKAELKNMLAKHRAR